MQVELADRIGVDGLEAQRGHRGLAVGALHRAAVDLRPAGLAGVGADPVEQAPRGRRGGRVGMHPAADPGDVDVLATGEERRGHAEQLPVLVAGRPHASGGGAVRAVLVELEPGRAGRRGGADPVGLGDGGAHVRHLLSGVQVEVEGVDAIDADVHAGH